MVTTLQIPALVGKEGGWVEGLLCGSGKNNMSAWVEKTSVMFRAPNRVDQIKDVFELFV
jgi:hypothetical protein